MLGDAVLRHERLPDLAQIRPVVGHPVGDDLVLFLCAGDQRVHIRRVGGEVCRLLSTDQPGERVERHGGGGGGSALDDTATIQRFLEQIDHYHAPSTCAPGALFNQPVSCGQ